MSTLATLWQDVRYGLRILGKNPSFTAVAVLTLALGIGANTAVFQLLNAVCLRTLPVKNADELTEVRFRPHDWQELRIEGRYPEVTYPVWEQIRDRQEAFSGIFAWGTDTFNLSMSGEARYANAIWVSGEFFDVLGVPAALGRVFTPGDDQKKCASPGIVISYSYWQREFGGDSSVIGKKLALEGRPMEIIGVTPASFFGVEVGRTFDVAIPLCARAIIKGNAGAFEARGFYWLAVVGRLKPGWSLAQAASHLASISPGIFEATIDPSYKGETARRYSEFKLEPSPAAAGFSSLRKEYKRPLWLLLAIAGLVLLIACANLANLMLARANARGREIAVRLSLGASRGRIIRQLLAESLLLSAFGAILGTLLAQLISESLVLFLSVRKNPVTVSLGPDWRVLSFTVGVTVLTCILFGLTPALRATNTDPAIALKAGGRGLTASRDRFGLRRMLVVSQVALSLVLLIAALLFVRSLNNLLTLDPGFRQEGVLVANLNLTRANIPPERRMAFKRDLIDRIRAIPGVEAAADSRSLTWGEFYITQVFDDETGQKQIGTADQSHVYSGYFETLGIPLLEGRDFDDRDTPTSPQVVIVNEAFARQFLRGENPIGRMVRLRPGRAHQIVGLVRNTKYRDLREEFPPIVYFAASQNENPYIVSQMFVRSNIQSQEIISSIKRTVGDMSAEIGVEFSWFKTQLRDSLLRERLMAMLSGFYGCLAILLACIGLYGVMSYSVTTRTNEIGVRMALGAQRLDILWLVMRETFVLTVIGVAVGLGIALGAIRLVSSQLYGLTPSNPTTLIFAVLLMTAVAALAGVVPARRASKVDPMIALRCE